MLEMVTFVQESGLSWSETTVHVLDELPGQGLDVTLCGNGNPTSGNWETIPPAWFATPWEPEQLCSECFANLGRLLKEQGR